VPEDNHSPQLTAEVKNAWKYTSSPSYIFMVRSVIIYRDNLTFTFTNYGDYLASSILLVSKIEETDGKNGKEIRTAVKPTPAQTAVNKLRTHIW
jgi:hypothetical protein